MNTGELSGMSYILQTSEPDRGVQNRSPEAHFNTLLKKSQKIKASKENKNAFKKAVVLIPAVQISLHSGQNVTTKATKRLV